MEEEEDLKLDLHTYAENGKYTQIYCTVLILTEDLGTKLVVLCAGHGA
jgi:hypothetical protein